MTWTRSSRSEPKDDTVAQWHPVFAQLLRPLLESHYEVQTNRCSYRGVRQSCAAHAWDREPVPERRRSAAEIAMKPAHQLSPSDLTAHRVWEFANDMESQMGDETYVRPVAKLPVDFLAGRLVGAPLMLADGRKLFGLLGNIDLADPVSTEHFLTVTVFRPSGGEFNLARYHDVDCSRRDAVAMAAFLGLPVGAVFPMRYDITDVAVGHPDSLRRAIPAAPLSRLSREDLIAMALR